MVFYPKSIKTFCWKNGKIISPQLSSSFHQYNIFFLNIRVPPEHKPGTYFEISKTFLKKEAFTCWSAEGCSDEKRSRKPSSESYRRKKKNSFLLNCFNFLLFIHLILFIHSCWHTTDVYTCIQTITIFYFFIFQGLK